MIWTSFWLWKIDFYEKLEKLKQRIIGCTFAMIFEDTVLQHIWGLDRSQFRHVAVAWTSPFGLNLISSIFCVIFKFVDFYSQHWCILYQIKKKMTPFSSKIRGSCDSQAFYLTAATKKLSCYLEK